MSQDPDRAEPRGDQRQRPGGAGLPSADLHFRLVFENAGLGIALVGLDARPIRTNPAFRAILGYEDHELCAMRFAEFTHPDDVGADLALFGEMLAAKRDRYQIVKRYIRKDGRVVWVRLTVTAVPLSTPVEPGATPFEHVIAMVEDIDDALRGQEAQARLVLELNERVKELTALQRASRLLDEMADHGARREVLQALADLLPSAFLHAELATARISVGEMVVTTAGYDPDSTRRLEVRIPMRKAGPPGHIEVAYPSTATFEGDPFLPEELTLLTSLAEMLGGTLDRIHANERLALAVESTRLGVWEWDIGSGTITWSREMVRLAGIDPNATRHAPAGLLVDAEPGGRDHVPMSREASRELIHPDDVAPLRRAIAAVLEDPTDRVHTFDDFRLGSVLAGWRWVSGRGRVYRDHEGRPTRILGTVVDVHERRSLEEQLRQAQKMEAIGRLAGGVAHDFNNLLTVIGTNASYLAETLDRDAPVDAEHAREVREILAEISAASDRAARLTAQLLAFSRKSPQKLVAVEPALVVRGVTTMLRRLLGESITLSLDLAGDLGAVMVDAAQLEQVLMNLCINARDAMPDGGVVFIRLRRLFRPDGARVAFEIEDRGVGMDAATRARAFEPFFTTKPLGRGTGLGLSVALGIVQQSGGSIEIESEPSHGTIVRVLLPEVARAPAERPPSERRQAERPPDGVPAPAKADAKVARILVVEDEPAVARLVKRALESRGHVVFVAGDADEAEALVAHLDAEARRSAPEAHTGGAQARARLDLLVTDIRLPGRSGRMLAEALIAERPELAVIYVSGYDDEGGVGFLQKPFHPNTLLARVDAALAEAGC